VLHGQSDVIGGNGEQALQLGVRTQADPVALQEGLQGATAHVLHDQKVRLCTAQNIERGWRTHEEETEPRTRLPSFDFILVEETV